MLTKILHNPRCSKSRATLDLVKAQSADLEVVKYLESPPDADELRSILNMLGMSPRDLMRKGEAPYSELNLDDPTLDDSALIDTMVQHPILIERPIVVSNGQARIGRPPESVLEIL
ncbi:MAG: arsenate reductase (glutaredoxin) [Pseudomonadota bacterium]